ncbi:MAG: twin-arginine translocase TatA/TatE family subunit [Aeromicrobium sp.]|uniref:Sec-independent protein translocase subunit TatA/TatB n=1 Tax=Aeromicrobium sp. TaxID=1871063 RepID=UPI0039E3AD69
MFGLTFEKLLLIGLLAAVLVGPSQLPVHARRLGRILREARDLLETARQRAEAETGVSLDPHQYDVRQILREALDEPQPVGQPAPPSPAERLAALGLDRHRRERPVEEDAEPDEVRTGA